MRKLAGLLTLLLFCIAPVVAQDGAPAPAPAPSQAPKQKSKPERYVPKYEISGAYTHLSFYSPTGITLGMNGWDGSFDYNVKWWLGVEGEVFGTYYNQGINGKTTIYTGMAGPEIFPFGHRKLTVFGHVLYGVGHYDLSFPALAPFPPSSITHTSDVWDAGGGLDFYLKPHLGIRLIQADYTEANFFTGSHANQGGLRVSFGVVYRFGTK